MSKDKADRYREMSLNYQECNQPRPHKKGKRRRKVAQLLKPIQFRPLGEAPKWLQELADEHKRNPTPDELRLLAVLAEVLPRHKLHCDFQFPIGRYILDFFIPETRLCIELDGAHHFTKEGRLHDQRRRKWLWKHRQIRVVRFPNGRVRQNMMEVVMLILKCCGPAYEIRL